MIDEHAVVAELSQRALTGVGLQALLDEMVARVAQRLDIEYASVLELLPDGSLVLRASIGWQEDQVGRVAVAAGTESQAGYTLLSDEPVIVEDLRTETRFSQPPLLHGDGAISGASVIVPGRERPFGVLAVHTTRLRAFTPDDASFLRTVANILATVVEREEREAGMKQLAEERGALQRVAAERIAALERLDQLKEEFIATASHDLKSPLTSIRGYAQMLRRRVRTPAPDLKEVEQGLDVIDDQAAAMTRLLDDLLDAASIQAGWFEPRTGPCELGECLETVLARLSPDERERVEVRLAGAPLAGDWEQKRIEQVLANLVGNALKYSPESERVSVVVERGLGEIEVTVSDRGMGIPPEELPLLFGRFHRTPQARASGLSGTGLGLYICRGIVEAHGGRMRAESGGEGQGATFQFTLPAEPLEREARGPSTGEEGP